MGGDGCMNTVGLGWIEAHGGCEGGYLKAGQGRWCSLICVSIATAGWCDTACVLGCGPNTVLICVFQCFSVVFCLFKDISYKKLLNNWCIFVTLS